MPRVAAVTAVREWLNGRADLVGTGNPIQLGAHRKRIRSPGQGAWVLLSRVGGSGDLLAEETVDRARIGAVIYAGTDEAAEAAAVAYANAVEGLAGDPVAMGSSRCLVADNITGPQLIDQHASDGEQYAYQVDADFYLI
jgi:hypothetical protein